VLVLEACHAIGTKTSARSSEVVHAGMYYPVGSLKARLCVQGREMLYDYCSSRGVGHRRCGKLIVATTLAQIAQLDAIGQRAQVNGISDLVHLTGSQVRALEPALHCLAALQSPSTGVVDSHGYMLALLGDLENAGGVLALNSPLDHAECAQSAIKLEALDGTKLLARKVVNAAGLQAPALASRFAGLAAEHVPAAHFAKGHYFTLSGRSPFLRLIYPVPEADGLGVHLTLDLAGQARFGPDVLWVDAPDDLAVPLERGAAFYGEIRKYWPDLPDGALVPGYAGIRPKIHGPGEPARDFCIHGPEVHGIAGLVNLFGIESPGLTASMAIGEHVAALLSG
jgi:L-2-hydroxyglutarate oxidase LhgO